MRNNFTFKNKKNNFVGYLEKHICLSLLTIIAKLYLKKSDLTNLLYIKFPSFRQMWYGFINELFYLIKVPYGAHLNTCNIEITNACNLRCKMCPVNRGMTRSRQYMDFALFKQIIDKNHGLEFILPFQWGEPLLNKDFFRMVEYATSKGIRVMFTTNGTLLNDEICKKIVKSGAERITFSVDGIGETHTNIRGFAYGKLKENILNLKKIRDEAGSDLKIDISMVVFEETEKDVAIYFEEWKFIADRLQLIPRFTHGKRKKRCRELWRGILVILADGKVSICCADYNGVAVVGDVTKEPLSKIWNNRAMRQYRLAQIKGKFPNICANCNEYNTNFVSKRFS